MAQIDPSNEEDRGRQAGTRQGIAAYCFMLWFVPAGFLLSSTLGWRWLAEQVATFPTTIKESWLHLPYALFILGTGFLEVKLRSYNRDLRGSELVGKATGFVVCQFLLFLMVKLVLA